MLPFDNGRTPWKQSSTQVGVPIYFASLGGTFFGFMFGGFEVSKGQQCTSLEGKCNEQRNSEPA